jgi:hypothetical protein
VIEELDTELDRAGIDSRHRRRIVAEFRDHLSCDPAAPLGDPRQLANEFADALGTHRARSSAVLGFIALAVAGAVYAIAIVPALAGNSGFLSARMPYGTLAPSTAMSVPELLIGIVLVIAPQVAFVAGALALLRVVRHRDRARVPAAETRLVLRRCAFAVTAGAATMAALLAAALLALHRGSASAPGATGTIPLTAVAAVAGLTAIVLAAFMFRVARTFRIHGSTPGAAGWLGDDLAALLPAAGSLRSWQIAGATATAAGAAVFLAGVVAADGFDGALRGVAEAGACILGYVLLGDVLGLRPTDVTRADNPLADSEIG